MKTFKLLLLALVATCCTWQAKAQILCGVDANFTVSTNPNNVPVFTNTTVYGAGWAATSYYWDFGDGTFSNLQSPSHVFTSPGIFNVCLYVTAQLQGSTIYCTDTICHTYTNCNNMVSVNASSQVQGSGVVVYTGTATSNYPPLTYSWTFQGGNPSTSTTAVTTVQYAQPGNYNACFTATDANGCSATQCITTGITSTPCSGVHASFTTQTTVGGIVLTSNSTGVVSTTQYQWFMDGSAISTVSPNTSYTYTGIAAGNHTFCLKVFSANVTAPCDDTCMVVYIPGSGPCSGAQATFTETISGNNLTVNAGNNYPTGTKFQWWLNGTSTTTAPTNHQYSWSNLAAGVYQLCLYIYNPNGVFCDSTCKSITIIPTNPCTVNLNAGFQTTTTATPGLVYFLGNQNPTGAVYHWIFGDGTDATTNTHQTSHQYPVNPNATTYIACLKVTIPGTTCIDTFCQTIVIPGSGNNCQAYFTWTSTPNGEVHFTNQSTPTTIANSTYSWSFGDGSGSSQVNPVHVYNSLGSFVVCLTMATTTGCTSTYCDTITIGGSGCNLSVTIQQMQSSPPTAGWQLKALPSGGTGAYTYLWSTGATTQIITLTNTSGISYCVTVTDGANCTASACHVVQNQATDTVCGVAFIDANGNGALDPGEQGIPGAEIHVGSHLAYADSNGHYLIVVPAGTYSIWYCAPAGYTFTLPITPNTSGVLNNCGYYPSIAITGGGSHCGFNFGVQNNSVTICGKVFFDANNNGVQDQNTESGIQGVHVVITSSTGATFHAYTNSNGEYCKTLPAGTYTITIITTNSIASCAITPQSITLTTATGQNYPNQNFAVYCQPGICNLKIEITPHTTITPGFPAWYSMHVSNIGTSIASGTANFFYDPVLTFNYANPVQTSHNASTHTVSFNVNNLLPGQTLHYWIHFNANPPLNIGQFVFTLANINPDVNCNDVNLNNNVDTIHQAVTASWDPNNKLAYVTNYDNPQFQLVSSIEPNQRIEYVVNFQNTGNMPAVNVVVEDLISSDLDFSTFEFLGSSHPCIITTEGSKLNFKFSNIMLPDSTNDEPNSHGHVRFALNAVNGLAGGHVISDDAAIYFDYNDPVITNDAAVILLEPNGIDEVAVNTTVVIAPNPMKDYAEIRVKGNTSGFTFRVTDITGRVVTEERTADNTLPFRRDQLSSGIYVYQVIQNNKPAAKGKLVIE
ncbi:MAG: PKD domain-containing protein [Chitinophagales bacterium]|nr:PKD domain-containing protein [Chitinophagales bacterium]